MQIQRWRAVVLGALLASGMASAENSAWTPHKYTFNFMGFTTTYSCEGLEDKLRLLLQINGAGPDKKSVQVVAPCSNSVGRPDKLAFAYLTFSSLSAPSPASASAPGSASESAPAPGEWKHVELSPRHPYQLGYGDCELIEEFRDRVLLPMFTTRNVTNNVTCIPHQSEGSNFFLAYDVFVPATPPKT